jgi:hypothetical protein
MRRILLAFAILYATFCFGQKQTPLLLRQPTVSKTSSVFNYAGDLWIVDRNGSEARRLTTGIGEETNPKFSPDGSMIAFTGEYAGNRDVYIVPAEGGQPKDPGWKECSVQVQPQQLLPASRPVVHSVGERRIAGGVAASDCGGRLVFAGREADRICSSSQVAAGVEALPWGADYPDLDREPG